MDSLWASSRLLRLDLTRRYLLAFKIPLCWSANRFWIWKCMVDTSLALQLYGWIWTEWIYPLETFDTLFVAFSCTSAPGNREVQPPLDCLQDVCFDTALT
jgi:hypothetical protein